MTVIDVVKAERAEDKREYNEVLWILEASINSPSGHHTDTIKIVDTSLVDMIMELKDYGEENIASAKLYPFEVMDVSKQELEQIVRSK